MSQLPGSQQPAFSIKEKFVPGETAVAEVRVVASAFQAKIPAKRMVTAAMIPTTGLRILKPPFELEDGTNPKSTKRPN